MWQKHAKPIRTTNYAHSYSADAPNFQRPKPSNETAFCPVNPQFSVAKYFLWHGKPANPEFDWSFFVKICPHSLLNTYLKWIVKIIIWRLKSSRFRQIRVTIFFIPKFFAGFLVGNPRIQIQFRVKFSNVGPGGVESGSIFCYLANIFWGEID